MTILLAWKDRHSNHINGPDVVFGSPARAQSYTICANFAFWTHLLLAGANAIFAQFPLETSSIDQGPVTPAYYKYSLALPRLTNPLSAADKPR